MSSSNTCTSIIIIAASCNVTSTRMVALWNGRYPPTITLFLLQPQGANALTMRQVSPSPYLIPTYVYPRTYIIFWVRFLNTHSTDTHNDSTRTGDRFCQELIFSFSNVMLIIYLKVEKIYFKCKKVQRMKLQNHSFFMQRGNIFKPDFKSIYFIN